MPTLNFWKNVQVSIGTLGAAQAVTSVSLANPGVVTYVGVDPANGDFLAMTSVLGMTQIDSRIFRGANVNVAGNTIELEGQNTIGYTAFVSGNMQPVTFSATLATALTISSSGGDFPFIDVTTIHDSIQKQVPGTANAATFSFSNLWDVADPGLVALKLASDLQAQRAIRFVFGTGHRFVFLGYVGATLLPGGQAQDKVTTEVAITMFGTPTYYST